MASLFGSKLKMCDTQPQKQSISDKVESELKLYRKEGSIDINKNPLEWWRDIGKETYPNLAICAKKYLAIPATSVPSERVFSTAGDIITAQRSSLKSSHVDKLLFLKKNWNI